MNLSKLIAKYLEIHRDLIEINRKHLEINHFFLKIHLEVVKINCKIFLNSLFFSSKIIMTFSKSIPNMSKLITTSSKFIVNLSKSIATYFEIHRAIVKFICNIFRNSSRAYLNLSQTCRNLSLLSQKYQISGNSS